MADYLPLFQKADQIADDSSLVPGAQNFKLKFGNFGVHTDYYVVDFDNSLAEVIEVAFSGTTGTVIARGLDGTAQQTHSATAKIGNMYVPSHYVRAVNPVGSIRPTLGSIPDDGYIFLDGGAYDRTMYARLYNYLGSKAGAGNGTTTFTVPDWRGRVPVGLDVTQTEFNSIGKTGGEAYHALIADENAPHSHEMLGYQDGGSTTIGTRNPRIFPEGTVSATFNSAKVPVANAATGQGGVVSSGKGTGHNNLQPYTVCNWQIRY